MSIFGYFRYCTHFTVQFALAMAISGLCVDAKAALNLSDPIPIGPQVKVGKLDNGLTYYIQKNSRPQKRLELRLVVKAGSILEDEDQRGLAHFTEHMAFNGSTHFKKHELVSWLQSIGLNFGADLNAYTGINETVYILPVPTDKREDVEKAFLVLQDWAQGVSFVPADVDMERSIVLEELRNGKGAQDRMSKVWLPKVLGDSLYAKRMPIGTEESLKHFSVDAIKRFYKDWYRPDLMAVVVVGDITEEDAKVMVERYFAGLRNPTNERPRNYPKIPARTSTEALVVTDPEATNNLLQVIFPVSEDKPTSTLAEYRHKLQESLFSMMLGQRMQELTQQASPPFVGGGSSINKLVTGYRYFGSTAVLGRAGSGPAMDALVLENQRARQFGFEPAELERSKKSLLRAMEQAFAEREKTDSARYVGEYIRNFLEGEDIAGIANELLYVQEMLPTITLAELNGLARATIPDQSAKLLLYLGSSKEEMTPKEDQLLTAAKEAEKQPVAAKMQKVLPDSLMDKQPRSGRVVSEKKNDALGTTELLLSNGIRVVLKPTDFKSDEILMSADRFGGQSLYGEADKFNALYATRVADFMGLAQFTPTELEKILAGKVARSEFSMTDEVESIRASSSLLDMETMFQLVHLKFAAPRRDADLFRSFVTRSQDGVKNLLASPQLAFFDALMNTRFNAHPRVMLMPRPDDFGKISIDRAIQIYQERFSSAKGFTFVLVGSFTRESIDPLIAKYLASLPATDLKTQYVDLGIRTVPGAVQKKVYAGTEAKSVVTLWFAGDAEYSEDENLRIRALTDLLNIRFTDELREKQTLIYGGNMAGRLVRAPYAHYRFGLQFPCGPDNADKVVAALFSEIEKVQTSGPTESDLAKVKQNWQVAQRKSLRENGFWREQLQTAALYGADPAPQLLDFDKRASAITAADLQAAAKRYLRRDQYVQVVLYPEADRAK